MMEAKRRPSNAALRSTAMMTQGESKEKMEAWMNAFGEIARVRWDRWAGDIQKESVVYGWVARADGRFDFVVLRFSGGALTSFITSSDQFSRRWAEMMGVEHSLCKRVEEDFPHVTAIKLESESNG